MILWKFPATKSNATIRNAMKNRYVMPALLLVSLALGFWLRWDGLDWGRKSGAQFHPDEPRFVEQANALDRGLPLRKSYVFGFGEAIRAVHAIAPSLDYARIARGLSIASGMLLCLVVFAIARELKLGANAAALACAFTSLNTMCVIHSHFGTADMTYVLFLYLFALAVLRGWLLIAAVVTGLAMAAKFGMILIPSLLWLVCSPAFRRSGFRLKAVLQTTLLLLIALFVFLAAQGFTFDRESIRMISLSAQQDNLGGFEHRKWQNIITYSGVAIRALGIPVFSFAVIGLARVRRAARSGDIPVAVWIAFLPFALHALGLLAINTTFPRHFLPLVPLLLILAARSIEKLPRFRAPVAAFCLAWSALLAWSDGFAFSHEPRFELMRNYLGTIKNPDREQIFRRSWSDPFYQNLPSACFTPHPNNAESVFLHEGWTWRFNRSEINPLSDPDKEQLYHASTDELRWYRAFKGSVARGTRKEIFEAGPPNILPEQFLYDAAWGSFEKFAGKCTVYERAAPQVPIIGKPAR